MSGKGEGGDCDRSRALTSFLRRVPDDLRVNSSPSSRSSHHSRPRRPTTTSSRPLDYYPPPTRPLEPFPRGLLSTSPSSSRPSPSPPRVRGCRSNNRSVQERSSLLSSIPALLPPADLNSPPCTDPRQRDRTMVDDRPALSNRSSSSRSRRDPRTSVPLEDVERSPSPC